MSRSGTFLSGNTPLLAQYRAAMALCAAALVGGVLWFAFHQDIWIDESTQLSGMTLSPLELMRWLAGEDQGRFGVPGDRMPPLSYLIDWAWSSLVSGSEISMRILHSAIAVAGVLVLARVVWGVINPGAAVVLTLMFALSTRFAQTAVEIRAYPILVALTCLTLACHLRFTSTGRGVSSTQVATFGTLGILLVWTHFFGALAWFSLAAGLLWHFRSDGPSRTRIAVCCGALVLWCFTLVPFAFASVSLSETPTSATNAVDVAFYFARLLVGSVEMIWPAAAIALLCGASALFVALVASQWLSPRFSVDSNRVESKTFASLVLALGVGVGGTVAAAFVVQGFEPLKPSYSLWTLPLIFLLLVAGWQIDVGPAWWRSLGRHLAVLLVLGGLGTSAALQWSAPLLMIHGPHRFLVNQLTGAGTSAVIYDGDTKWGYGYFPLRYSGKGDIQQWRIADNGEQLVQVVDEAMQSLPLSVEDALRDKDTIVVAVIRPDRYQELRNYLKGGQTGIPEGTVHRQLQQLGSWSLQGVAEQPGYYSAKAWTWRRQSAYAADPSPIN